MKAPQQLLIIGLIAIVAAQAFGQVETPFEEIQPPSELPEGAVIRPELVLPPSIAPATVLKSPSLSSSFLALDDDNTTFPPDTHGAVGLHHVMTMLNTQVRIQDRSGVTNYSTTTLSNWWSSAGEFTRVFDPKVLYDPYNHRWIATVCANDRSASSSIMIAVSQTDDPTGTWHKHKIDADSNDSVWADYPSIGFNKNWIVAQFNMFNISGGFNRADIYVFNKTNVYAGGTNHTLISYADSVGTLVPAVVYDNSVSTMFLLQSRVGSPNGYLRLYTITGEIGSEVLTAGVFSPSPPRGNGPLGNIAPQTNTSVKIFNNDSRVQNAVYRNGTLWATHTIFLPHSAPTRSAVQWWQISTNSNVLQVGRIDDSSGAKFYAFPSIAVNRFNDVLIGYSSFSSNQYASANYSFRAFSDANSTLRPVSLLKSGEGAYYKMLGTGRNRWGDYSATIPDPTNDTDFWSIQEYAATPVGTGLNDGDGRWAMGYVVGKNCSSYAA